MPDRPEFQIYPESPQTKGKIEKNGEERLKQKRTALMLAMLLMDDELEFRTVLDKYRGDILMFDLDVIENSKTYGVLKSKEKKLFTLFGEMPISIKGHFQKAYPENLAKHGVVFGFAEALNYYLLGSHGGNAAESGNFGFFFDNVTEFGVFIFFFCFF